jgi:hypothetical protein
MFLSELSGSTWCGGGVQEIGGYSITDRENTAAPKTKSDTCRFFYFLNSPTFTFGAFNTFPFSEYPF